MDIDNKQQQGELTQTIIGCCFEINNILGPGFLEKIYVNALKIKLKRKGLAFEAEKEFTLEFENIIIGKF